MPKRTEISTAVIGGGFIGTVHVEALRRLGIRVAGLLASTPERSAERASQLGLPRGYADLKDLLADDAVQVVHVASPNELHHPQAIAIVQSGRHVVCEKPLALTSRETADLVAVADASGLVNALSFNLRFYPINQHAAEIIRSGGVGEVRLVTGRYFQDWLLHPTDWNWRLEAARGGSLRAVGDIGSHWLDLAAFLTGLRVESVVADLATFVPVRHKPTRSRETFSVDRDGSTSPVEMETEDLATILLRFEGGARGAVAISQISAGRKNSLQYEIDGSSASLAWDSEHAEQLWIGHRDQPNEVLLRDPALMGSPGHAAAGLPAGHAEGFGDTFVALFAAIYDDILAGRPSARPPYPTFADGHDAMLVADAVAESARSGRWTSVARAPEPRRVTRAPGGGRR